MQNKKAKVQPLSPAVYNRIAEYYDVRVIVRDFERLEHFILCSENLWFEYLL